MKKLLNKLPLILLVFLFIFPLVSQAVNFDPYEQIQNVDLGKPTEEEVPGVAITIVNVVLGFLSLIAVILIIYAGFTYMFSGGNSEKMKKAKDILIATVIGLVIILAAWGITVYLLHTLGTATSSTYTPPT